MYATPTGPENVYLELQPKTRMKVAEVYENVVEDESATDVGVQRVNIGNTNQDGSNRRQAPPKTLTPTGPEKVCLELQPKTRIKVGEVYVTLHRILMLKMKARARHAFTLKQKNLF